MKAIRRHIVLGLVLVAAIALTSTAVRGAGATTQHLNGSVAVAAGADGWCGVAEATMRWATGMQGVFAYEFEVDPATRGRPFVLRPRLPADLDIFFFPNGEVFPDLAERGLGPERGLVPTGASQARVCLFAGGPTDFTYAAG